MDTPLQVEVLRLHCEHLRTLLERVISELTIMKNELAPDGKSPFATLAPHMDRLGQQSEKIAVENFRLQSFLHSLELQKPDEANTDGASPQSVLLPSDTAQAGKYKIVCTLDGKEPAIILYEKYATPESRLFPNDRHAIPIHEYLSRRARGMRWESEPPVYDVVPVEE